LDIIGMTMLIDGRFGASFLSLRGFSSIAIADVKPAEMHSQSLAFCFHKQLNKEWRKCFLCTTRRDYVSLPHFQDMSCSWFLSYVLFLA
jgi:hypothetical protein